MRRLTTTLVLAFAALAANAQPADSSEQLVERWKQAMSAKDVNAYQALFAYADPKDKAALVGRFKMSVDKKRGAVRIMPFSTYEKMYNDAIKRGVKSPVEPKAWLVVEYASQSLPGGGTSTETDVFLIGMKDGKYVFSS